jgi:hypothetical protein
MKYITTIINKLMPKELPKHVGRWNIEQCNTKINHKIDLSNEDHCGPCGQYALKKLEIQKNIDKYNGIFIHELRSTSDK